jgi:hypothetical protein
LYLYWCYIYCLCYWLLIGNINFDNIYYIQQFCYYNSCYIQILNFFIIYKYSYWILLGLGIICYYNYNFFYFYLCLIFFYKWYVLVFWSNQNLLVGINWLLFNSLTYIHPLLIFIYNFYHLLLWYFSYYGLYNRMRYYYWYILLQYNSIMFSLISINILFGMWWALQEGSWESWWIWDLSEWIIIWLIIINWYLKHSYTNFQYLFYNFFNYNFYVCSLCCYIYSLQYLFSWNLHIFFQISFITLEYYIFIYVFLLSIVKYVIDRHHKWIITKFHYTYIIYYIVWLVIVYLWYFINSLGLFWICMYVYLHIYLSFVLLISINSFFFSWQLLFHYSFLSWLIYHSINSLNNSYYLWIQNSLTYIIYWLGILQYTNWYISIFYIYINQLYCILFLINSNIFLFNYWCINIWYTSIISSYNYYFFIYFYEYFYIIYII